MGLIPTCKSRREFLTFGLNYVHKLFDNMEQEKPLRALKIKENRYAVGAAPCCAQRNLLGSWRCWKVGGSVLPLQQPVLRLGLSGLRLRPFGSCWPLPNYPPLSPTFDATVWILRPVHTTRVHGPCSRTVNTAPREHGSHFAHGPWTRAHGPCPRRALVWKCESL